PLRHYIHRPMNKDKTKTDKTRQISSTAAARVAAMPSCIVVIYGGDLGRRIELPRGEITIGRDDENAISAAVHTVSRRHARLFIRDEGHYIEDLGSTNGTFVNDQEIDRATQLRNGDLVRCGGAVFKFIEGGNVEAL